MAKILNRPKISCVSVRDNIKRILVFCLALIPAFALWIYAIGYDSTLFQSTYNGIAVTVVGEDALREASGLTLAAEQYFSSITVVATGKRSELNMYESSDFTATADVSSVREAGWYSIPIKVSSPNGIEIASQSSAAVEVYIDEFIQRAQMLTVSVDTGTSYVMYDGVVSVSAVANPLMITVSGPKSVLDSVHGAFVKFNLDGVVIDGPIQGYGEIELRDKNGKVITNPYITLSESTAFVSVSVISEKTVPVKVVYTGNVLGADSIGTVLSHQSIKVKGSPDVLEGFSEIVIAIDERTIKESTQLDFQINGLLPQGVVNASGVSGITVDVSLPALAVREFVIPSSAVRFINVPEERAAEAILGCEITVIGAADAVDSIDIKNIILTVDCSRYTVGYGGVYVAVPDIDIGVDMAGMYILESDYKVNFSLTETVDGDNAQDNTEE